MSAHRVPDLLGKGGRLAAAHVQLGGLLRWARDEPDERELVRRSTLWCRGFIESFQSEDEIVALARQVRDLRPRVVVEIGTAMGGTLFLWSILSAPDATLISIDLPSGPFGGGYPRPHGSLFRRFRSDQQELHLLRCDSHKPATMSAVHTLLQARLIDFLFIDGDHTYDGVRTDFEIYSPMVRPGGLIAFHDIASDYQQTQVHRFWKEVRSSFHHQEYLADASGRFGIGVLHV